MRVELRGHLCVVTRELGDPRMHAGGFGGTAESHLLYHVKLALNAQGHDLIKRRVQADGHMWGWEKSAYLRDRKWRFCIVDGDYALRDCAEEFNKRGEVRLLVERWEGKPCAQ